MYYGAPLDTLTAGSSWLETEPVEFLAFLINTWNFDPKEQHKESRMMNHQEQ